MSSGKLKHTKKVYLLKTKSLNLNFDYSEHFSSEEIFKISRLYRNKNAQRNALGSILLQRYVCMMHTGLDNSQLLFGKEEKYKKPYCKNLEASSLFYNVSHSGDYAVIVTSDSIVGIDLQVNNNSVEKIIWDKFKIKFDTVDKYTFFWTKIESLIKMWGTGLSSYDKLNINTVNDKKNKFTDISHFLPDDYHCCICSHFETNTIFQKLSEKMILEKIKKVTNSFD